MAQDVSKGVQEHHPYVPSWMFKNGAKDCKCGCHEGYHNDDGACLNVEKCNCDGFHQLHTKRLIKETKK